MRNIADRDALVDILFDTQDAYLEHGGEVFATLDAGLARLWRLGGSRSENLEVVEGNRFRILGIPASLSGIPMSEGEEHVVTMKFRADEPMPVDGTSSEYFFQVTELVDSEPVGGVGYAITARALQTDTDEDGIFDVVDPDDDNDGLPDAEDPCPLLHYELDCNDNCDNDERDIRRGISQDENENGVSDECDCPPVLNDSFETYPLGEVCGLGGWEEWSGSIDVCGEVTVEEAFSGDRSLKIVGSVGGSNGQGDDIVQRFDIEGGRHVVSMMTFVPTDAEGQAFAILLNHYPEPFNWSLLVRFDMLGNRVRDHDRPAINTALVRGEWVPLEIAIDLDTDLVDVTYNGVQFITGKSWINGSGDPGEPRIEALDLYAGEPSPNGTTGIYFDDIVLRTVCEGGGCLRDPAWQCDGDVDGDGQVNPVDSGLIQSAFGSIDEADLCQYDLDCDGQINPVDSGIVQSLFGTCDPPRDVCP